MNEPPQQESIDATAVVRSHGFDPTQLTPRERESLADLLTRDDAARSSRPTTPIDN